MAEFDEEFLLTAYARSLGIAIIGAEGSTPVIGVEYAPHIEGRPGALHGGAISGILETAGFAALRSRLQADGRDARLKPINITVEFLRAGKLEYTRAVARITRLGRRNANLWVEAWQEDRERPIATAVMNILVSERAS